MAKCPKCKGEKGWHVYVTTISNGYTWKRCPVCRGTGEVINGKATDKRVEGSASDSTE